MIHEREGPGPGWKCPLTPATLVWVSILLTLPFAVFCAGLTVAGSRAFDWEIYRIAADRALSGAGLYDWGGDYGFVYSPLFAFAFAPISWLGPHIWRFVHVLAAFALPSWPMRIATVMSWPFWFEMQYGNLVVFVLLPAAWALRGSRLAALVFLGLTLLMPRPLMLPVAGWLLWKRQGLRLPFAGMAALSILLAGATGYLEPWIARLLDTPEVALASDVNFSPTRLIGSWWLFLSVPIGAWLTLRHHLGWASVLVSPYLLPQYFLMLILELVHPAEPGDGSVVAATRA